MADEKKETGQTQGQGINISIGGNADIKGVALGDGNQIVQDADVQGNLVQADEGAQVTVRRHANTNSVQQGMSIEDALKLLQQLSQAVDDVEGVSRKAKIKAKSEVELAVAEMEEPEGEEPDKEIVAGHLKTATETLKAAGATVLQAVSFGKLVAGAVTWLGANYQWLLSML